MNYQTMQRFHVVGISVRTTNEHAQAAIDIPALWNQFIGEGISGQIPNKVDQSIYCMYTDYEKDHTKPYTTFLGCRVSNLDNIPNGMMGKTVEEARYIKRVAKGSLQQGAVYNEWLSIWKDVADRTFTTDFEVYGERAADPANAEVDIFVAVQ